MAGLRRFRIDSGRGGGTKRAERLDALVSDSLARDETYEALLTVPGIDSKTAATPVDAPLFHRHDEPAAHTRLAPATSSRTHRSTRRCPSRAGNRTIKNPLIYS